MKFASEQQQKEHSQATLRGALEGAAGSGAVALAGSLLLQRRWPYYRSLPPSLKLLGAIIIVAPCLSIQAERRGLQYEHSQWTGVGRTELERVATQEEIAWESMTTSQKIGDWSAKHQYSLIIGSWAASLGVAGAVISRDKLQSTAQKVVQVRMWAQGLTVGLMIVAGILTHSRREAAKHRGDNTDHSWANVLEEQAREREALKVKASQ